MNYFELFDLPLGPVVNKQVLAKKYTELQKKYHPDFNLQLINAEKEDNLDRSADINKAYKIFRDEDRTLQYFLEVTGLSEPDEKYELPPDFLMEMMEMNESLMEKNKDEVQKEVEDYNAKLYADVKPIIDSYWMGITDGPSLQKLKAYHYKKKYLNRILDRLAD